MLFPQRDESRPLSRASCWSSSSVREDARRASRTIYNSEAEATQPKPCLACGTGNAWRL